MQLKNILTDEDAVSPVIGVILMVAITVILAAVIGAFVLGIGSNQEAAPQATLAFSYDEGSTSGWDSSDTDEEVTLSHDGGETIQTDQITITYAGTEVDTGSSGLTFGSTPSSGWSAGGSYVIEEKSGSLGTFSSGDEFVVTWEASSGDSTQILKESTVP